MTKKQIEKKALDCLGLVDLDIPVPVIEIAHKLGIIVHEIAVPDIEIFGSGIAPDTSILAKDNDQWLLFLNETSSAIQKRFAVAHALGHFLLHGKKDVIDIYALGDISILPNDSETEEKEAHFFALCLLIPSLELREEWQDQKNIKVLADKFFVTDAALVARLLSLKLAESVV